MNSEQSRIMRELYGIKGMDGPAMAERLRSFPSLTRPGKNHDVFIDSDGAIQCTCEGWRFNGYCWHVDSLMQDEWNSMLRARRLRFDVKSGTFRKDKSCQ